MNSSCFTPGASKSIFFDLFNSVDDVNHAFINSAPHEIESPHALAFIFNLRVNLSIPTKPNATPQVIHREKMIFPGVIQYLEQNGPLHSLHFSSR